ncbi:hypothetical protein [Marinobacter xestospongiae]|uniref:hypothetical protein n=1 Tax=Marinobacter xestospongiae TaxID=994319 RepID=UPI002003D4C6|nr:hypothetical protein [Marinobacter xestospongiae]MCK7567851.1 hypothetical protein [Marinobacter xestospongiae]
MTRIAKLCALLMASGVATASQAQAENIDVLMSDLFPGGEATYIGYDSVERMDIPVTAAVDRKYLIVDFRFPTPPEDAQLQASVHKVCMTLLKDRELIRTLSDAGYDMVSVAFDRNSQYDCL